MSFQSNIWWFIFHGEWYTILRLECGRLCMNVIDLLSVQVWWFCCFFRCVVSSVFLVHIGMRSICWLKWPTKSPCPTMQQESPFHPQWIAHPALYGVKGIQIFYNFLVELHYRGYANETFLILFFLPYSMRSINSRDDQKSQTYGL